MHTSSQFGRGISFAKGLWTEFSTSMVTSEVINLANIKLNLYGPVKQGKDVPYLYGMHLY